MKSPAPQATAGDIEAYIKYGRLVLFCGEKVSLLSSACAQPLSRARSKMPVVKRKIGDRIVDVLRDSGCSGNVVKLDALLRVPRQLLY